MQTQIRHCRMHQSGSPLFSSSSTHFFLGISKSRSLTYLKLKWESSSIYCGGLHSVYNQLKRLWCIFVSTVFDLITAHTPISAQSRNSIVFRLQPVVSVLFLYFFIKAYVVGIHLNCIDLSMQSQMSTHNICLYKENQKKNCIIIIK